VYRPEERAGWYCYIIRCTITVIPPGRIDHYVSASGRLLKAGYVTVSDGYLFCFAGRDVWIIISEFIESIKKRA
jgi:hypothetical protein